jgi:hypothetical protein
MKKILIVFAVLIGFVSVAYAASYIGTTKLWKGETVNQSLFIYTDTIAMNSTTPTDSLSVQPLCKAGSVIFANMTGTTTKQVAMQTTYRWSADELRPPDPTPFYNTIGSTSSPYHEITSHTDTHKFDFNSRWFNEWRFVCLSGCDLTNTIGTLVGFCDKEA